MARRRTQPCWYCGTQTEREFCNATCVQNWRDEQAARTDSPFGGEMAPIEGLPPVEAPPEPTPEATPTPQQSGPHITPNGDGTYTLKLSISVVAKSVNILSLQRILDGMDADGNIGLKALYKAIYE